MDENHSYGQFIVQSLVGHFEWSSTSKHGKFFHVGTVPNKKGNIFVSDLRVMVCSSPSGYLPCAMYARRARSPLEAQLTTNSWDVLGTNLSVKKAQNEWDSETSRLMLMDRKDFNSLGSIENVASGPPSLRSRIKCFSIILPPIAIDVIAGIFERL